MIARLRRNVDGLLALAVVALGLAVAATALLRPVEGWFYDRITDVIGAPPASEDVVIVAIDDRALESLGAWPWSRYTLGELNALIARGEPAVVGYALPLERPQNEHARETLESLLAASGERLSADGARLIRRAIRDMGTDRVLAASFRRSGGVVLGARFHGSRRAPGSLPALPGPMRRSLLAMRSAPGDPPLAWIAPAERTYIQRVRPPVERIAAAAQGIGIGARVDGGDGAARRFARLAFPYAGSWLPAFPLLVYAGLEGIAFDELAIGAGGRVRAGAREFPAHGVLPAYVDGTGGPPPVRTISAAAVHAGRVDPAVFRGRAVLVGFTAPSLARPVLTSGGRMPSVEAFAQEVSGLLTGALYRLPDWALVTRLAALALVGLYLLFVLPRLATGTAVAFTALLTLVALGAEVIALSVRSAWIPLVVPTATLWLGHVVLGARRAVAGRLAGFQRALTETRRELAALQRETGRLDEAFRQLRRCQADRDTLEQMYALGLDYERRRRYAEAADAFALCARADAGFRDAADRAQRNHQLQHSVALGGARKGGSTQTLVASDAGVQKPVLGRYELERELGKGAMGTVYLGRDPRLGREVAIKTMPLDQEFEGQTLAEVKARFLREAETAGRLAHPNIVTIHDAGEEQDLAWIAMDYLPGTPMIRFASAERLLPPAEIFEVLAQVADALAVAHAQNVIHRDIKPDNIIYDRERGKATVTDFGVACLVDHRHTRTGTILGSPSYMSPEQLAARDLDGRSDLFSMGVTLYQLLTGELPFVGDSLSNLMYRITHERQREVRRLRPDLPACATTITNRCLEKDPAKRYASAVQLAQALRRCRAKASPPT